MDVTLFDKGLYTLAEASGLTEVPTQTLRRWVFGYSRNRNSEKVDYSPISPPEIGVVDGQCVVGFRDLLETRVVQAFRSAGVSWHVIKLAAKNVSKGSQSHPFLSKHFRTDGRTIFLETVQEMGELALVDLARNQHAFHAVIAPSLFKQIDFDANDVAVRWYPMWPKKTVFLDPHLSFGRPLVENIPAATLAAAAKAEKSIDLAAKWFKVRPQSVRAAVEWQERLAA